jgi:hypothetical protein
VPGSIRRRDHPALFSGARHQISFTGAGCHAGQQGDARGAAVERIAAALVERQLIEDQRRHDDRDRHLLITLGDEQRHRGAEVVGQGAQRWHAQRPQVVVERRAEHRERGGRPVAAVLALHHVPVLRQRGEQPVRDGAVHADVVGDLLCGHARR